MAATLALMRSSLRGHAREAAIRSLRAAATDWDWEASSWFIWVTAAACSGETLRIPPRSGRTGAAAWVVAGGVC